MAKLAVTFPSVWNTHVLMDSKDFATVADILDRSQAYELIYHDNVNHAVKKPFRIEASSEVPAQLLTEQEFEALKTALEE